MKSLSLSAVSFNIFVSKSTMFLTSVDEMDVTSGVTRSLFGFIFKTLLRFSPTAVVGFVGTVVAFELFSTVWLFEDKYADIIS
jgi:hypothetical protein